jgi:hypothetical protein
MIKGSRYNKGFMANNNFLPEFQASLRSRKFVPEKNIPYFVRWAGSTAGSGLTSAAHWFRRELQEKHGE